MTRTDDKGDKEIKKDKVHTGCLVFAWYRTFHVFVVGLLYIENSSHGHIPPGALAGVSISDTDPTNFCKNHSLFPPSPNSHIFCELLKATSEAEMQMCGNVLASKQILHDSSRLQFLCRIISSSANQVQPRCHQFYVCWSGSCKLS